MSTRIKTDAHTYRVALIKKIWVGARQLGDDFNPRALAPERLSGQPGETFSQCTLEELRLIAHKIKGAGARIWVPAPPKGLSLRQATPNQMERIKYMVQGQTYLRDPHAFFILRLKVKDPDHPSYAEAQRMLGYLTTKQRSLSCAKPA